MTTELTQLLEHVFARSGHAPSVDTDASKEVCSLLRVIDIAVGEGSTAVIKLDGERSVGRYTIIISGGALGSDSYRGDGDDLRTLLEESVRFYNAKVWQL